MEMQALMREDVVLVFLYTHTEPFYVANKEGLTAEAVCSVLAKECNIPRLSANLFALYVGPTGLWLSPGSKVHPTDEGLTFRMRFHMSKSATNITSMEENVARYMFAQYHYDFLHDNIPRVTMEESLGLVVLDIVRYTHEKNVSIGRCLRRKNFKKFLPKSLSKDLTVLDKWKLQKKIRKSLNEFRHVEQDVNNYRMMFLISLMEENSSWGVEEFQTVTNNKYTVSIANKGVKRIEPPDQAENFKLLFENILSIGMMASRAAGSNNWIVLVNQREDAPKEFVMENREKAVSMVALIDGYCRLQVDFYHYLFHECAPPSLVQLVKNRCHGPIPLSCAKRKVEEAGSEDGIYLIRQNPEDFFSYCLTVRMDGSIKNYKVIVNEDGSVNLPGQQSFPDVRTLAEYYRSSVNCTCLEGPLTKIIPYQNKEKSLHMYDLSVLPEPPRVAHQEVAIEWIKKENMSKKRRWHKLGGGSFTTVYRGEINKRGVGWVQVAIKCPNEDTPQQVQQKFSSSVDIMSSWCSQSIISFLGIGAGFTLIMEYAPFGSMDTFLQSHQSTINHGHLIAMAVQLIDGLEYLESWKIVHGNISAHNVLVVKSSPRVRVKLGDPMMSRYYHSLQLTRKIKNVRWTAPELLYSNVEPTLHSDRWSFGMVLWQIMAVGQIPFASKSDEEVLQEYRNNRFPPYPQNSIDAINLLIGNCWHVNPTERDSCKHLLREISCIYMRFQEDDGAHMMYWELPDDDDEIDPIVEDLSEGEDESNEEKSDNDDTRPDLRVPFMSPNFPENGLFFDDFPVDHEHGEPIEDSPAQLVRFSGIEKIAEGTLRTTRILGSGNFGVVYKGMWKRSALNEMPVAIKEIKNYNEQEIKQFEEEILHMSKCDHKNIAKVLGFVEGDVSQPLRLVMEFVPLGALNVFLREKKNKRISVPYRTMLLFSQQVAQGMAYLGDHEIVHRDLAARNVLVASEATSLTDPEVKISDFGLARKYTDGNYYMASGQNRQLPMTLYAIECIGEKCKFNSQSDVWSFGILLWEIFSYGQKPVYKDDEGKAISFDQVPSFLQQGYRLLQPMDCPSIMYRIMNECWNINKYARPTFRDLITRLGSILEREY